MSSANETRPQATGPKVSREVLRGIGFALLAVSFFPLLGASAKYLSAEYGTLQIVWARYTGHLLILLILFAPVRGLGVFKSNNPRLQILRSLLLFASTMAAFFAYQFIPLGTVSTIYFTAPLTVTAMSVPILKETVGARRWAAVCLGFLGALVVLRPGLGAVHPAAFAAVAGATCYAFYQLFTRKVAAVDTPLTAIVYTPLVGATVATLLLPLDWRTPELGFSVLLFCGLGAFGGLGHFCLILAYRRSPTSLIAPFLYAELLGATSLDYLVFDRPPDLWTGVGAALIVGSGLYVSYRER